GLVGVDAQGHRTAVVDDVGDLVRLEPVVDRGDVQPRTQRRPVDLHGAQVVLGHQGHHVTGPQPRLVQDVGQLRGAALEIAVAERVAGPGHHRREPFRRLGGVRAWVHGRGPSARVGPEPAAAGYLSCTYR